MRVRERGLREKEEGETQRSEIDRPGETEVRVRERSKTDSGARKTEKRETEEQVKQRSEIHGYRGKRTCP